jgi:4-phospho-D-threonate 3-dehydrogenase / 4-phospho-D-erythronate 3-dehydrogenase
MNTKPIIAITMGDAAGIGPEIILKSFAGKHFSDLNIIVVGDISVLDAARIQLGLKDLVLEKISGFDRMEENPFRLCVWDMDLLRLKDFQPGKITSVTGDASFKYITESIGLANKGHIAAVVTAPINKEAISMAGHSFPGHTEIFAQYTGTKNYAMLLYEKRLSVIHVSTHISMADAVSSLNQSRIEDVIRLADRSMEKIIGRPPKIAVAGLNPHAGENGLFGHQEINIIGPAIGKTRSEGINVSGPYPPDTVFLKTSKGLFDIVVAMYHDQGHIPVKLLGFESGVNVTVGLPFVRTSVDHGTAFDIAWKGIASNDSLLNAVYLAGRLIS